MKLSEICKKEKSYKYIKDEKKVIKKMKRDNYIRGKQYNKSWIFTEKHPNPINITSLRSKNVILIFR